MRRYHVSGLQLKILKCNAIFFYRLEKTENIHNKMQYWQGYGEMGIFCTVGESAILWEILTLTPNSHTHTEIYIHTNNHGNTAFNKKRRKHPMAVSAQDWLVLWCHWLICSKPCQYLTYSGNQFHSQRLV